MPRRRRVIETWQGRETSCRTVGQSVGLKARRDSGWSDHCRDNSWKYLSLTNRRSSNAEGITEEMECRRKEDLAEESAFVLPGIPM